MTSRKVKFLTKIIYAQDQKINSLQEDVKEIKHLLGLERQTWAGYSRFLQLNRSTVIDQILTKIGYRRTEEGELVEVERGKNHARK